MTATTEAVTTEALATEPATTEALATEPVAAPPGGALSATTTDVSFLLQHTAHTLTTRMTAALAELGMSPREHCVLAHAAQRDRTQAQLAELCDLDKTTMVVTVDTLERAGLAERVPSPTDRRARIIRVTPAGADMVRAGQAIVDRVHQEVLDALPDAERTVFVSALNRLATGHLAEPVDCPEVVRRPRQSRK
ncbi:MarR family winged helix-turn-helix transcriptional regulator [Actinacidiphila epipremni]|uniref:Winged helix-turn-helix transcriptional regulator n=1 Tax=Actinacidiphila epipremni TaxID=2053013 RepID=A0ABX0ZGM0_9ACTN|nr:MarR family winged helix-turn-helix transcriptional regulator [Actinacidiphila epipremni]NJP42963.1 winged helix-turn-helix transcriptional regulator [Actinacidiphila epipremni]